jgi:hypothetical protein
MNNSSFDEQKITSICQSLLPKMQTLEDMRVKARKRKNNSNIITVLTLVLISGFLYWNPINNNITTWIIIGVVILGIIIFLAIYLDLVNIFKNAFKQDLIRSLILSFIPNAIYKSNEHVPINEYFKSELFQKNCDRFSGKNYVAGMVGKTAINFSELHTEYKTVVRTKNGGTRTEWHTIFNGIFLIADLNKNIKGRTFILPDFGERYFGGIGKWFQKNIGDSRGKLVYLEDPKFEKAFAVYATDPVEARYLITLQMQERLVELHKHLGGLLFASFIEDKLYLAFYKMRELFKPDLSLSLLKVDTLKYYSRDITHILSIVDILDLNTRIWGK